MSFLNGILGRASFSQGDKEAVIAQQTAQASTAQPYASKPEELSEVARETHELSPYNTQQLEIEQERKWSIESAKEWIPTAESFQEWIVTPRATGGIGAALGFGVAALLVRKQIEPVVSMTYLTLTGLGAGGAAYLGPKFGKRLLQHSANKMNTSEL